MNRADHGFHTCLGICHRYVVVDAIVIGLLKLTSQSASFDQAAKMTVGAFSVKITQENNTRCEGPMALHTVVVSIAGSLATGLCQSCFSVHWLLPVDVVAVALEPHLACNWHLSHCTQARSRLAIKIVQVAQPESPVTDLYTQHPLAFQGRLRGGTV